MLLAVDIGNTNIKLGLFSGETLSKFSVPTREYKSLSEKIGNVPTVRGAVVSSVVPGLTEEIVSAIRPCLTVKPHIVSHLTDTGLCYALPHPERLGADRIVSAAWAYRHFGVPAVVVDFGTATTISVVGQGGVFIGGAIVPGLWTMARSFNEHTAALPLVELTPPSKALGMDTSEAIVSGIVYGTAGAVARIIYEIEREIGYNLKVAVTGGNSALIERCLERVDVVEPDLSLLALKMIYERIGKLGC